MRMFFIPLILTLSACVGDWPGNTDPDNSYFGSRRNCDGCQKNDSDRRRGGVFGLLVPDANPIQIPSETAVTQFA